MMRKHIAVAVTLLLFAVSAFAQEKTEGLQQGTFRVFAFGSNFGYTQSDSVGSNWHGGYGLGLEYRFRDRWSAEISVAQEESHGPTFTTRYPDGTVFIGSHSLTNHPVDVVGQYHFITRSAWKPYVGAGARYVRDEGAPFVDRGDRLSAQLVGGIYYNVTPRVALRLDLKRLLRTDSTGYDDGRKVSIGVGWAF